MEQMNLQITQTAQPTFTVEVVQNLVPVITAQVLIGNGGGTANIEFGDTMTGTGTPTDPVNVSNDILGQISDNTEQGEQNASQIADIQNNLSNIQDTVQNAAEQISEIQSVIPATANAQNQLADQGFVNSSIQTATAYFRGDWATWADVPSNPELYPVDATGNHTPTTNDYLVVIADEQTNGGTWRYKYTGIWSEQGKSGWQAEYQVNETPLTAAQLAALNSGVTAQAVADISKNQLPDQTGNAGKFLKTNGDSAEWSAVSVNIETAPTTNGTSRKLLVSDGTNVSAWNDGFVIYYNSFQDNGFINLSKNNQKPYQGVVLGFGAKTNSYTGQTVVGGTASSTNAFTVVIGAYASATAQSAIQLGCGGSQKTNSDANTFKVGNDNGNFEMMDANGNIPIDRLTYVTDQIGDISTALTAILGE